MFFCHDEYSVNCDSCIMVENVLTTKSRSCFKYQLEDNLSVYVSNIASIEALQIQQAYIWYICLGERGQLLSCHHVLLLVLQQHVRAELILG